MTGNALHKTVNKVICVIAALLALLLIICLLAFDVRLKVRKYEIDSDKIDNGVRIALVTDLHSCFYGEQQKKLIDALDKQSPDVVLLGGDIFDDVIDDANTEIFIKDISRKYPCYYVTGNHEWWSGKTAFLEKMSILEENGVTILKNEVETVEINGEKINVCGIDDPASYALEKGETVLGVEQRLELVESLSQNGNYTLLLSHRPELFETYVKYDFDLVLSGHAHGGQWRIPFIVNGVYAPNQGVFPEYAGGSYEENQTSMIVSRGLASETTRVPRIFNRPELVIIDLK